MLPNAALVPASSVGLTMVVAAVAEDILKGVMA
jgi:hypothetical protein